MAGILGLAGLGIYRALIQANSAALEREIESIAGTLHDSLEPMLPPSADPTVVLQQIFPDLCVAGQVCAPQPTVIQRHNHWHQRSQQLLHSPVRPPWRPAGLFA